MPKLSHDKKSAKNIPKIIATSYIALIFLLGISYAYLSTSLQINGIVSIESKQWPAGILPVEPTLPSNGASISNTFQSKYLSGTSISSNAMTKISTVTETYDVDNATYRLSINKTGGGNTYITENFNLNFTIKNVSQVTWENGTVESSYTATNTDVVRNLSGTLDKTTLAPTEETTLNMTFTLDIYNKFKGTVYKEEITYKVNFLVGTETRTATIIITLSGA